MLCTIDIRFFKTVCHLTTFALLLHLGEIEKYRIRWKLTTDSEWLEYKDVPPSAALCREEEAADLVCHTLTHLAQENYTIQVQAYNTGILQGSPWSAAAGYVIHGDDEEEEEVEGEEGGLSHALTIFTVLAVFVASALAAFLGYRCCAKLQRRRKGFDRVLSQEEYRKPIIRNGGLSPTTSVAPPLRRPTTHSERQNSYVERLALEAAVARRSCQDPLPPLPPEEPIYSDLEVKKGASEEYLAPNPVRRREEKEKEGEEEESYLAPNPVRVASRESLDEEGYLRPNFNRFQRLDTTRPGSKHFKS